MVGSIPRLLCWVGRHAWQFDGVVYTSPSYRCRRCGRREARNWDTRTGERNVYCYRCDQCGTVGDDKHTAYWHVDHRRWDDAQDHYDRPTDVDFCSLACLQQWAAAQDV